MAAVYKYNSMNKAPQIQNARANGFAAKRWDDFCWSCHRDNPTLFCTSCVRAYHAAQFCSGSKKMLDEEKRCWKCPVCIDIQTDLERMHTKRIDVKGVSKLLSLVLERIKSDEQFTDALMTIDYSKISQTVAKPMDLYKIEQNIDDFIYRCFEAFLSDIKWIVHNVKVHSQLVIHGKVNAAKVAKWLFDMTKEEIYSIRMCHECYIGIVQNHRFDVVCKQPHLIVWAKQKGYPYWPAKLMSINTTKNTVEVRYFGGKHYRAVIKPMDCYMYSADKPSLWLGAHKKAFELAQLETNSYIDRLKEVYEVFNLAAANTPLNPQMLERHLYDTMPKAWVALGKTVIPPQIPTVLAAAAARISRRHSIASRFPRSVAPVAPVKTIPVNPPLNPGRVMTRRMSIRLNEINEPDDNRMKIDGAKRSQKISARRQTIQVDMVDTASSSSSKKRKINDDEVNAASTSNNRNDTTKSADKSMFKVPDIPRKIRKVQANAQENASLTPSNQQNDDTRLIASNIEPSPEMQALFSTFIENNTSKMTNCIRTLTSEMLHDFWHSIQPMDQVQHLQNQLITMQTDYARQIDELKRENNTLKQKLNAVNAKYDTQLIKVRESMQENAELKEKLNETKLKMAATAVDLKRTTWSNKELTNNLNEISNKSGECQTTMVKLKTQHAATKKMLKDAEAKMATMDAQSRAIIEKNTGLNVSLQWAVKQYQDSVARLKDLETKCNIDKSSAFEQCYRMINDNKKKQWCAMCQKSGGRYFCGSKCEEKYWRQNRQ